MSSLVVALGAVLGSFQSAPPEVSEAVLRAYSEAPNYAFQVTTHYAFMRKGSRVLIHIAECDGDAHKHNLLVSYEIDPAKGVAGETTTYNDPTTRRETLEGAKNRLATITVITHLLERRTLPSNARIDFVRHGEGVLMQVWPKGRSKRTFVVTNSLSVTERRAH